MRASQRPEPRVDDLHGGGEYSVLKCDYSPLVQRERS